MSSPPIKNVQSRWRVPTPREAARFALVAGAVVALLMLLSSAGSAIAPFVIGAVLAYLTLPIVNRLNARMPRWAAILIVYLIVALIIALIVVLVIPPLIGQIQRLVFNLTDPDRLRALAAAMTIWYDRNVPPALHSPIDATIAGAVASIQQNLSDIVRTVGPFLLRQLSGFVGILAFVFGLLVVPIWLFYVLSDARKAHVSVNRLLSYRARADFWNAWELIDRSLSAYIRGQLTLGVIIGTAMWAGLIVLDFIPGIEIDYILVLAIWAGIAELVPMIGAVLGGIPAIVVALLVGGPASALAVLGWVVVLQLVENNVLVPRIIGESVGVHPAILLIALVVFGQAFGFIGVVLAAPLTAIVRDLFLYTYRRLSGMSAGDAIDSISVRAGNEAENAAQSKIVNPKS